MIQLHHLEVPFVPQSMLDDEFQLELPPPPARGPRHVQGEIRLPAKVRDEIEQAEREMVPTDHLENQSPERSGDIIQPQSVELDSPMRHGERTSIPQLGGGYMISHSRMLELQHNHLNI